MDGLQAERNYRFCVKVVSGSGTTDEQIKFYDDIDLCINKSINQSKQGVST